jgi:CheY-like chemotaxis protein
LPVRVVIAEDEAIIRLDLKEILEEEGYEVVGETGRGDEAVTLVRLNSTGLPAIRRGDRVRLAWDPADVTLLASRSEETR